MIKKKQHFWTYACTMRLYDYDDRRTYQLVSGETHWGEVLRGADRRITNDGVVYLYYIIYIYIYLYKW